MGKREICRTILVDGSKVDSMLITGTKRYKNDENKENKGSVMIQNWTV